MEFVKIMIHIPKPIKAKLDALRATRGPRPAV
jgi:hypothetical protein